MIYRDPKVDPQLQAGTATEGADCAVQTTRAALRWALALDDANTPTVRQIRNKANKPAGGLDVLDVKDVLLAYGVDCRITNDLRAVWGVLREGWVVIAAVNYRFLNANYPAISGDRKFVGTVAQPALHSVLLFGAEKVLQPAAGTTTKRGPTWIEWHDPLHDARRSNVPKEHISVRAAHIGKCMAAMPSGVQAVIVKPMWEVVVP